MSNKDTDNQNSQPLFNEDITKNLVKKILDDNTERNIEEDTKSNTSSFNIEYEEYEEDYDEYEDDYDEEDYDEYEEEIERRYSRREQPRNSKRENKYRKNIEIYGKDFFDDDYDYDESSSSIIGRVISFSVIIVLTISTTFLAFSLVKTKNELTEAKAQIEELLDDKIATENKIAEEALKNENERLKAENESLKANAGENNTEKTTEQTTNKNNTTTSNISSNNSNNSTVSEYIVKEGDVIWNISKKVYGNGAHYQKILDANKLTENSVLKPGQKLIIPKLN